MGPIAARRAALAARAAERARDARTPTMRPGPPAPRKDHDAPRTAPVRS